MAEPDIKGIYKEIETTFGLVPGYVKELPPSALTGFWGVMRDFYLAETAIPNKYKDLIGLAISGVTRCRYCALFHTEAAKLAGATAEEIAEASTMGGFTMLASTFVNAQQIDYDKFVEETHQLVSYVRNNAEKQQKVGVTKRPEAQA